jgi:hypothetical protein
MLISMVFTLTTLMVISGCTCANVSCLHVVDPPPESAPVVPPEVAPELDVLGAGPAAAFVVEPLLEHPAASTQTAARATEVGMTDGFMGVLLVTG